LGWPVARIPFEKIEKVDWRGDEYYADPHIYCSFAGRAFGPYEEILIYKEMEGTKHLMPVGQFVKEGRFARWKRLIRRRK
jgi:hypothetical protein